MSFNSFIFSARKEMEEFVRNYKMQASFTVVRTRINNERAAVKARSEENLKRLKISGYFTNCSSTIVFYVFNCLLTVYMTSCQFETLKASTINQ